MMEQVIVSGSFDNLRSPEVRLLQEAARLGPVHLLLWTDALVRVLKGCDPKFPEGERQYVAQAVRYVTQISLVDELENLDSLPLSEIGSRSLRWVVPEKEDAASKRTFSQAHGLAYHVIPETQLSGFPLDSNNPPGTASGRKKALVTGCFDWLHSGHVRFFEEVSQLGDLYVVVGSDQNVRLLKGEGHPLFGQEERRYMAQSMRYVTQALVSSGLGWMDAEPEIALIKPELYVVNQDGDNPEKRAFCAEHNLDYVVLQRLPKAGLPRRESTKLRGF